MPIHVSLCRHRHSCAAFTLVELLAVVAIIAVLVGLVLAGLGSVRQSAHMAQSLANLRTIGVAVGGFLQDNKQRFPTMGTDKYATPPRWSTRIAPYGLPTDGPAPNGQDIGSPVLFSPFVETHADSSDYGASSGVFSWLYTTEYNKRYAGFGISWTTITNPSLLVTVTSCRGSLPAGAMNGTWYFMVGEITPINAPPNSPSVGDWNTGKIQALFADGHVEAIPVAQFFQNSSRYLVP